MCLVKKENSTPSYVTLDYTIIASAKGLSEKGGWLREIYPCLKFINKAYVFMNVSSYINQGWEIQNIQSTNTSIKEDYRQNPETSNWGVLSLYAYPSIFVYELEVDNVDIGP